MLAMRAKKLDAYVRHYLSPAELSIADYAWLEQVEGNGVACIVAEGLLMYLHEEEVKEFFTRLQRRSPGIEICFDAYSRLTAKTAGNYLALKKSGAPKTCAMKTVCNANLVRVYSPTASGSTIASTRKPSRPSWATLNVPGGRLCFSGRSRRMADPAQRTCSALSFGKPSGLFVI